MNPIDHFPQGYWKVKNKKFISKHEALKYASVSNEAVHYVFFDHVWQNFDRSLLGTISLKELYKQRAQQLRDKYDYLILYFSGGADSYNVLFEVITSAFEHKEAFPKASHLECLQVGAKEWDIVW
jgi:hypothetical protein